MLHFKKTALLSLLLINPIAWADTPKQLVKQGYSLTVQVNKLRNTKGVVRFSLYNKKGSIPDENYQKFYQQLQGKINNGIASVTFKDLPKGRYAINILHDENNNKKIDKGFLLPTEGVGFSQYKSIGLRNRPTFSKASFELNSNITKQVTVIYF